MFGRARPIGCLVTIGTGMSSDVGISSQASLWSYISAGLAAKNMLGNSELAHLEFQNLRLLPDDSYYRFNFGEKKEDGSWKDPIPLDDYQDMKDLQKNTQEYMEQNEVARAGQCAKKLTV